MNQAKLNYSDDFIRQILNQVQTIALVGASNKPHRASYQVMQFLLNQGYKVIPVNPNLQGELILGQACYPNLKSIKQNIDLVDIFRSANEALNITLEAIEVGAKTIWMQLDIINLEAEKIASKAGVKVVMNRCPLIEINRLNHSNALCKRRGNE